MGSLLTKIAEGATKMLVPAARDLVPQLAVRAVREWNGMVQRGERDRARAAIRRELRENQKLAQAIYEKYRDQMTGDVRALYDEIRGEQP